MQVANLHAFARLYGLVRWFHPSDAASATDWDSFAVDGARRIIDAPDVRTLRARLTELFAPIAPTMYVAAPGEPLRDDSKLHPMSVTGLDVIAWQHKGYGDSTIATGYSSKRLHRSHTVALPGALYASLSQRLDAAPFRGTRVRLRGKLRTGPHARGQLWLRVDSGDLSHFFDNMYRHPALSEAWVSAEIVGPVATDATAITFGVLNTSSGTVWYDDLELAAEKTDGTWTAIDIQDAGFEAPEFTTSWHMGIGRSPPQLLIDGWTVMLDHERPASGSSSLRIEPTTQLVTDELFGQAPKPGETVDVELGCSLRARVPIVLYSRDNRTIGDDPEMARRVQATRSSLSISEFDPVAGIADIIIFWNVLEHFWPYWDTTSVDWSAMLDVALTASIADRNIDDHIATLERLSTGTPDGHIAIACPGETQHGYPPFAVDLVESQVVVTRSVDPALRRGDVILSVDGKSASQLLATEQEYMSGSPHGRIRGALKRFGRGKLGAVMDLRIRRGAFEIGLTALRGSERVNEQPLHSAVERLDDGVYYVDLSRISMSDIDAIIAPLSKAPGVVFDMRGDPNHNHQVLSYLVDHNEDLRNWEMIPLIIRPDSAAVPSGWEDTSTWNMPRLAAREPHIVGRVAFLTGSDAISSAESFMALVEYYRLGAIVGAATAGTNGDIAQVTLPLGCTSRFTARRVTKPDGRRHHLLGVQPTVPAARTIAGVIAGRDEIFDRGIAYVRRTSK